MPLGSDLPIRADQGSKIGEKLLEEFEGRDRGSSHRNKPKGFRFGDTSTAESKQKMTLFLSRVEMFGNLQEYSSRSRVYSKTAKTFIIDRKSKHKLKEMDPSIEDIAY